MYVKSFSPAGIEAFSGFLERHRVRASKVEEAAEIARDPNLANRLEPVVEIEPRFTSLKRELAADICAAFEKAGYANLPLEPSDDNLGLWAWMAAVNFSSIRGRRGLGAKYRYIMTASNLHYRWYRHRIAGPARISWLFRDNPSDANLFLAGVPHEHSDESEQFNGRKYIALNRPVMAAANKLYFDKATARRKAGRQTQNRPGTIRHYISVIQQLQLTYDLQSMTPEQILDLLPPAFDRWRD